jgi:hypothetical protein
MKHPSTYPLNWPDSAKRARSRIASRFGHRSYARAEAEIIAELGPKRMGATHVVVSSNVRDRSSKGYVSDPGVAVYFRRRGKETAMALDRYHTAADNAYALAKTIEALRAIERYGSATLADQAFSAFTALPPAAEAPTVRHWREVLGVPDGIPRQDQLDLAELRYRKGITANHPDRGGSTEVAEELNGAIAMARQELR